MEAWTQSPLVFCSNVLNDIILYENICIFIKASLMFVPEALIDNKSALGKAWCQMVDKVLLEPLLIYIVDYILRNKLPWINANPVYGVNTICLQVRRLRWGHPSLFHTATSLLIWYKMFCMRDISYRFIWMEFISMFSMYAQSGMHSRFNW